MEILDDDPLPEELYMVDESITTFKPGSAKDGFPCGVCGKIFFSISALSTHMRFHANDRPFKCSLCDKSYVTSSHLRRHFYNAHPPTEFQNQVHTKKSQGAKSLAIISTPKLTRGYYSDETVKSTDQASDMDELDSSSSKPDGFNISIGDSLRSPNSNSTGSFLTKSSTGNFLTKSSTPLSSKCEHCHKVFANPHYLKVHLRFHTGERPYQCTLCPSSFITASHLRRHERQLHNYDKNSFIEYSDSPQFNNSIIPSTSNVSNFADTEDSFNQSNFDGNSVNSFSNDHMSNENLSFPSMDEGYSNSNVPVEEFLTKDMWDKQTVCQFCNKKFNYPGQLKVHLRFHKGDRPFECSDCNKTYITASHLKRHRLSAHSIDSTKSKSAVNKSPTQINFSRKTSLLKGQTTNSGPETFFCSFCNIEFESDSQLQIHNYQFHPLEAGTDDYSVDMNQSVMTNDSCMIDLTDDCPQVSDISKELANDGLLPDAISDKSFPQKRKAKKHKKKIKNNSLECEYCNKKFQSHLVLRVHKRLHKNERPHKCEFCEESFTLKSLWLQHRIDVHNCEIDDNFIPSIKEDLVTFNNHAKHNFIFEPQFQLLGDEINYIQGNPMRNTPLRSQNSNKCNAENNPFAVECHLCFKKFTSVNYLKVHLRYHGGIKPYKCHVCNKAFTTKSHLNRHKLSKVHQNMEYTLSFTSKQMVIQRQQLSENIFKQTPNYIPKYLCTECGRHCRSPAALEIHLLFHKGEKPFACDYCNRRFTTKSHLKRHNVQVHGVEHKGVLMLEEEPLEDKEDSLLERSLQNDFDSNQDDSQHSLSCSEKDNEDMKKSKHELPCPVCGKVFYFPANLRVHMRFHTKERPYRCRICLKSYIINSHLRRHLRQAHNVPWNSLPKDSFKRSVSDVHSYSPPASPSESMIKINLKQLDSENSAQSCMSTRSTYRPFKCEFCFLSYTTRSHLVRHQRTIHGFDPVIPRGSLSNNSKSSAKVTKEASESPDNNRVPSVDSNLDSSDATEPANGSTNETVTASLDSLQCHFCNKQFKSRANLEIHLRFHTGSKPYKCHTCGSCFTIISHLKRHQLKVHHDISPNQKAGSKSPSIKCVTSLNDMSEEIEATLHESVLIKKVKTEHT